MQIAPRINDRIRAVLYDKKLMGNILDLCERKEEPCHFVVPETLKDKLIDWKREFPNIDFYLAHKATKSRKLIQKAKNMGVKIDVSSHGELENAINLGFKNNEISCSGPKPRKYIESSIENGCLISIDSIDELKKISETEKKDKVSILLRIANPAIKDRNITERNTRFGILKEHLDEAYKILGDSKNIKLKGFHFHADGYDPGMRAGIIEFFLDLIRDAREKGHFPTMINMGGGIKEQVFENPREWQKYVSLIEEQIINGKCSETWGDTNLGIGLNNKNKISGRGAAESPAHTPKANDFIFDILNTNTEFGTIEELLFECSITLALEPGFSAFFDSGFTIIKVIGKKKTSKGDLILTNGNMFTISSRMFNPLPDPILIRKSKPHDHKKNTETKKQFSAFVAGNLCREDDMIMTRKVYFEDEPEDGDYLIFPNTGAYRQHYESTTSQMHGEALHYSINEELEIEED